MVNLTCTALGYPAYSQIRVESADHIFQPVVVNSAANMSKIGQSAAGTLTNTYQTSLPVGKHTLVCETGLLKPNTTIVDSATITYTVIAGMWII